MAEYEKLVPPELLEEFRAFVSTGDASEAFLKRLTESAPLQRAADAAFAQQISELVAPMTQALGPLAEELFRQAADLPAEARMAELNAAAKRVKQENPGVGKVIEDFRSLDPT
jgi:hypothetical protein